MTKDEIMGIFIEAEREIKKGDKSDYIYLAHKYFKCGYSNKIEYNYAFGAALSIIGREYANNITPNSDYHNGIVWLSRRSKVSSSEIKAIRKSFKCNKNGYCYRLSYRFDTILKEMIELLKGVKDKKVRKNFAKKYGGYSYRDVLAKKQCTAIEESLKKAKDKNSNKLERVRNIQKNLNACTDII
jgi:hypothetical protein